MDGKPAIYLGRIVSKENFRAFIYGASGTTRLVESWDEFESYMQTGLWFATKSDALIPTENDISQKAKRPPKSKKVEVVTLLHKEESQVDATHIPEDAAFEVVDDFLPKG